jgi:hypothetical protein
LSKKESYGKTLKQCVLQSIVNVHEAAKENQLADEFLSKWIPT